MTYTVKLDLYIDEEDISSDEEVKDFIKESMSSSAIDVSNISILEVND
jgi:hypothetical protein